MSFSGVNMKDVEASFEVSLRIVEAGRPLAVGESLMLPPAEDVSSSVFRQEAAKQIELIPLSKNTS
jgi:hypothetical protein